ncbi:MAG: multicopper oxidase family protein [Deltaproteobacteria bacterium]|nr:multicopper oxidase family protein [Deltaproteobacteria bacterium]
MRPSLQILTLTFVTALIGCRAKAPVDDPASHAREQLEQELASAYPVKAPPASGVQSLELTAAPTSVQQFDGRLLDVWAYNNRVPGPVLRVRLGESIEVKLHNRLPQPTTIHWHGVRVPNAMDGVPGVTQKAVPPGTSFTYRFTPKDAGTFWFHPHVRTSEQVERGLYGVLVVDDAESLPYSRDEVWVLDDWRLGPEGQVDPRFVTRHDLAHDGRWGQLVTVNGDTNRELVVRPGERIRLRLANTSNGRVYRPDFSELEPRVIAVDGMYTRLPLDARGFELAPGNRLDLDITIPPNAAGRSFQIVDRFTRRPYVLAALRVEGDAIETPTFAPPSNPQVPSWNGAADLSTDVTYVLDARRGGEHGIQWTINGVPWGQHTATELPYGAWTRVRFQNDSARLHPMHIHGQFFKVIAKNGQPADEPFFRDTVLLHGRETIDVGMVPLDWGRWMMHCHILEHAESGMMTEIDVHEPERQSASDQ